MNTNYVLLGRLMMMVFLSLLCAECTKTLVKSGDVLFVINIITNQLEKPNAGKIYIYKKISYNDIR